MLNFINKKCETSIEDLSKQEIDEILCNYFLWLSEKRIEKNSKTRLMICDTLSIIFCVIYNYGPENYEIIHGKEFAKSREIYGTYGTLKWEGKNVVKHFDEVLGETLRNILNKLSPNNRQHLQYFFMDIHYVVFCRRGCENVHLITKKLFSVLLFLQILLEESLSS